MDHWRRFESENILETCVERSGKRLYDEVARFYAARREVTVISKSPYYVLGSLAIP